ncbi:hypothetical protein [Chondromyces crocatus]|uniref:Uncharacterized protein n=1 Tax=Chondromyces crocatus TaxID=52 RepID=A0A0K1EER1_CHOCO|nr:hypothetical protein [Chondromyces crocatus]AKT39172.1 uncharacterized protein CMC5_033190 [Chondromyces crocatus]
MMVAEGEAPPDGPWGTGTERRARVALVGGGLLLLAGLGFVGIGPSEVGRVLAVVGLLATIYGVHTFGRLGPEGEDGGSTEARKGAGAGDREGAGRSAVAGAGEGASAAHRTGPDESAGAGAGEGADESATADEGPSAGNREGERAREGRKKRRRAG